VSDAQNDFFQSLKDTLGVAEEERQMNEIQDMLYERKELGEAFQEGMANVARKGSAIEAWFKGAFQSIVDGITNVIPQMIKNGLHAIDEWLIEHVKSTITEDLDWFVRGGVLNTAARDSIVAIADKSVLLAMIVEGITIGMIHIYYYGHSIKASMSEALQRVNVQYRPNIPSPGEVMRAAFVSPGDTGAVRDIFARNGYKDEWIDLIFRASYTTYTPDQAFRLWLKGNLSDAKLIERLRENGLTDDRSNELKNLYDVVPPLSDLIMMLAKEAFEEDQVQKFGLDDEYPSQVEQWAKIHGLNPPWPRRYWRAHWNHASPGQVLDMLHYGLLTEADVYEYYRVVEIPTYWRDKLMEISYLPYARVDIRRMFEMGVITMEQVYQNYRQGGYDHDHATKLTSFALKLKNESGRDLTAAEVLKGLKAGFLEREDVVAFLVGMGYDSNEAEYKVAFAEYEQNVKDQQERIDLIGDRFKAGLIDEDVTRRLLEQIITTSSKVETYIAKWGVSYSKTVRRLTKTELNDLLVAGIIGADDYVYEMQKLGYSERYIGWFMEFLVAKYGGE
jgi:hypothetical protein